jgi:hypothetical protein
MPVIKRRVAGLLLAAGITVGGVALPTQAAFAKISPKSCETASGQQPPGQQPECQGGGLTQNPATNPAGHAPPGQQ